MHLVVVVSLGKGWQKKKCRRDSWTRGLNYHLLLLQYYYYYYYLHCRVSVISLYVVSSVIYVFLCQLLIYKYLLAQVLPNKSWNKFSCCFIFLFIFIFVIGWLNIQLCTCILSNFSLVNLLIKKKWKIKLFSRFTRFCNYKKDKVTKSSSTFFYPFPSTHHHVYNSFLGRSRERATSLS